MMLSIAFERLRSLFPANELQLNSRVSDSELDNLAAQLNIPIPPALHELLQHADGQEDGGASLWGHFRFLPARAIANDYRLHLKYREEIKNSNALHLHDSRVVRDHDWQPSWVPIGRVFSSSLFVDQSPQPSGSVGQIVLWNGDDCFAKVVAEDLKQFLELTIKNASEVAYVDNFGFSFEYK